MKRLLPLLLLVVFAAFVFARTPTPTPTPYCAYEYCKDGVFNSSCYYDTQRQSCACYTTIQCRYGCDAEGRYCAAAPTPTPAPTPYCPYEYCSDGVFHSSCYYDTGKQMCYCRINTPCESQRCNDKGTGCYVPPSPTPARSPTPSPTPTPTPAPTPGCANYCAGGVLFGDGYYDARKGECVYQTRYGCPHGCNREGSTCAEARPTPTPLRSPTPSISPTPFIPPISHPYPQAFRPYFNFMLNCSEFCADGTHYFNGTMNLSRGGCVYRQQRCLRGCAGNNRTCADFQILAVLNTPQFFYFPCFLAQCPDLCGGSPTSGIQRDSVWEGICYANGSCGYSDVEKPCWAGCANETACTDLCEDCTTGCYGNVARDAICFMLFGQYASCSLNSEETCTVTACDPGLGHCRRIIGNANFTDADAVVKPLRNAVVKATYRKGAAKSPLPNRHTGANGEISFTDGELYSHQDWDLEITVYLQDWDGRFEVRNGTNEVPNIDPTTVATFIINKSRTIKHDDPSTYLVSFSFASGDERPLAAKYFHFEEAADFAQTELGTPINFLPPEEAYVYSGRCAGACHSVSKDITNLWDYGIHISPGQTSSVDCGGNSPTNCEWHEFGHHIMADRFDVTPLRAGCNHCGYNNANSTDSWVEGWAEFMSMMMLDHYGYPNANLYMVGGGGNNMETNYQVQTNEEFAVASTLFDLMDPVAGEDCLDYSRAQIWNVIGSQHTFTGVQPGTRYIAGIYDLYRAFNDSGLAGIHGDCDTDGINNLDEIFIAHGAYYDSDDSGHYDTGEPIGYTKKNNNPRYSQLAPDSLNRPTRNGSYIRVVATDSQGRPVEECNATVTVTFPGGCGLGEGCDFTYNTSAEGCLLYYEPPTEYETDANFTVSSAGESAPPLSVRGSEFNRDYDPEKPFVYSYNVRLQPQATPTPVPTPTPAPTPAPTPTPPACPLGFALLGLAALMVARKV